MNQKRSASHSPTAILGRVFVPVVLLAAGWLGYSLLAKEEEKKKRPKSEGRVIKTQVLKLEVEDFPVKIHTQGVVRAHTEASLTAEVSGKVQSVAAELEDGAFFREGDVLLRLYEEDFLAAVVSAEAQQARAVALHLQEKAKADQALLNWQELGYTEKPNDLVLRKPQLREAEANVKAADADVSRARRDLERAKIRAPFDGRVLQRSVAVGQTITPGTLLALIYKTDFVEVRLPVAARELGFLHLPEGRGDPPVDISLRDGLNEASDAEWKGRIVGTEGALNVDSRELFAIARIDDPFRRNEDADQSLPPLRIGQPVRAEIPGKVLEKVMVVPRSAVRQLNRIYLVDEEKMLLERREITPLWSDRECHVIRDPEITDGALLATTRMVYAPNVSRVEILPDTPDEPETEPEGETAGVSSP